MSYTVGFERRRWMSEQLVLCIAASQVYGRQRARDTVNALATVATLAVYSPGTHFWNFFDLLPYTFI